MYIKSHNSMCHIYITEPTVYTDSEFGDGNVPIIYSNLECKGYEESLNECNKKNYGNFSCSRKKVAGIKCQDGISQLKLFISQI